MKVFSSDGHSSLIMCILIYVFYSRGTLNILRKEYIIDNVHEVESLAVLEALLYFLL